MPATDTYKVLWNDDLKSFAAELNQPACPYVFWGIDGNDEPIDFKKSNICKMMCSFFPVLGVRNLVLGDEKGVPTQSLVFIRDNRCEEITHKSYVSLPIRCSLSCKLEMIFPLISIVLLILLEMSLFVSSPIDMS